MDSNKSKTKHSENRLFLIVIVVLVAIFIGFIIFTPHKDKKNQVSIEGVDISSYIEESDNNGNIADHIKGDKNAPVTLFEYADFQCSGCANFNPWSKELLKEFDGKLRIIFRSYPLKMHDNAIAAASAAEAAGLQGYWEEYGDLLFSNQAEWFYSTGSKRTEQFISYFEQVTDGKGDTEKFRSDLSSEEVRKKIEFDTEIAKSLEIDATPAFFDENGKELEWIKSNTQTKAETMQIFRDYINKQLEEKNK